MKLWEAMKLLEGEPTLEFRLVEKYKTWRLKTDYDQIFPKDETLHFIMECEGEDSMGDAGKFSGNLLINDDRWGYVKQPVTWQEAIEAWGTGKIVSVDVGGCKFKLTHDDTIFGLSERMINLGMWYVED